MEVSEANGGAAAYERAKIFVGYRQPGMWSPEHGRHVASKLQEEVSDEGTAEVRKRTGIGQGAPASQRRGRRDEDNV